MQTTTRLDEVRQAIREGRAYLKTFVGNRVVTGYDHSTGWAVTNNTGRDTDRQSLLVTLDSIRISSSPCIEDRPIVRHSSFEHNGKRIPVTNYETERYFHWKG